MTALKSMHRAPGFLRSGRAAVWSVLVLLTVPFAGPVRGAAEDEMRVQAAYVINFVRYSRWPRASDRPLVISVLGTAENANALRELAAGVGLINGRGVNVQLLPLASIPPEDAAAVYAVQESATATDVLYVGSSHQAWSRAVATAMIGHPVLTVGSGRNFVSSGGMFGLYLDQGHVRFEVNAPVVKASSVDVSARLLTLARRARGR